MKRAWKAAVVVAALASIGAGLWWTNAVDIPAAPTAPPASDDEITSATVDTEVPTTMPRAALREPNAAWSMRYRFTLEAGDKGGTVTVAASGSLELASLRPSATGPNAGRGGDSGWLPVRLRSATLDVNDAARKLLGFTGKASELERPFSLRMDTDGRVAEVRFADGMSTPARAILAAVAHGAQFVRPNDPTQREWSVDEVDVNGTYQAAYVRKGASAVVKHWRSPTERFSQRAETRVRYAVDDGAIAGVDFTQRGKTSLGGVQVERFAPFALRIELSRAGQADSDWATAVKPATQVAFTAATAMMRTKERPRETRAFTQVLADVKTRAERLDTGGRVTLRNELTRAIARSSEAVRKTESLLRAGELKGRAETVVMAALVGARTSEAQLAVASLVSDLKLAELMRVRMLQAASFMTRPTPTFVASLERLSQSKGDPGYAAAVATTLGATLLFYRDVHPDDAKEAVGRLVKRARPRVKPSRGTEPNRTPVAIRLAWLAALGNVGDPSARPAIIGALEDGNELVRGGAALALRFQSPAACLPVMTKMMVEDRSIHVRENLVDAARFMGPAVMRPLVEKALYLDQSEHVRKTAAYTIAMWATTAPGLRKVLVDALKREKNARVIEALKNFVEQGRVAGKPVVSETTMGGTGH